MRIYTTKSRIEKYGFIENEDFTLHKFMVGKSIAHDYILKIDMAKKSSLITTLFLFLQKIWYN